MPNGVAVSGRGGPQPAKSAAKVVSDAVFKAAARTVSPKPKQAEGIVRPIATAATGMALDAIIAGAPHAGDAWKPNPVDLVKFLDGAWGQPTGRMGNDGADPAWVVQQWQEAQSPSELAARLGMDPVQLTPLLNNVMAGNQMAADAAAANAQDAAIAKSRTQRAYDGPARGGTTPDAIDRPATGGGDQSIANAFSMLTLDPTGMDSNQIQALISQLDAQGTTQRAQMLEQAKRQVMADTASAMADSQRLAEVYKAGVEGRPMPAVPTPGESTSQSRYGTAALAPAQVADPTVIAPTLDTSAVEQQVLMAAKGIEFQRIQEQRQGVLDLLKSQQADAEAARKAAEAEQKRQAKDVAKGETAVQRDAVDANLRKVFTRGLKQDAVDMLVKSGVVTATTNADGTTTEVLGVDDAQASQSYKTARKLFLAGASFRDVVRQVFPDSVDEKGDTLPLTQGQYKLLQAARFAAGMTPDELATAWNDYRDAGRVHFGYGVS